MSKNEIMVLGLAGIAVYLILKSQNMLPTSTLTKAIQDTANRYGISTDKLQSELAKDGGESYFGIYGY
jgi:hypothetical protein